MEKLYQIYNYINTINNNIMSNYELIFIILVILLVLVSSKKKHKNLKRSKNRKSKPGFYNTGYKCSFSLRDIIKFKLRLNDYCDSHGVRYNYLIAIKIFNFEFCRMKYRDQKGHIYKRNIRFGR